MLKLYLDTSVISTHDDPSDPQLQRLTREFWAGLGRFEVFTSNVVLLEVLRAPAARVAQMLPLLKATTRLAYSLQANQLVQTYLEAGVFTIPRRNDARHVAVATVAGMDLLVSWNFRHLVKRTVQQRVRLINLNMGYNGPEIVSPRELL